MGVVQRIDRPPKYNKNGHSWVASHGYIKFQQNKLKLPNLQRILTKCLVTRDVDVEFVYY